MPLRGVFSALGPWALADAPGGREELRELVDPRLRDIVDGLSPAEDPTALTYAVPGSAMGVRVPFDVKQLAVRIRDARGQFVGIMDLAMTAAGMSTIGAIAAHRRPRPLRANAARRQGGAAPGGDPLRRPRRLLGAGATPLHGQLLHARPPPRTGGGSVRDRRGRPGRPARRRRGRGVLPGRDGGLGVRRRARLHRRRPRAQGGDRARSPPAASWRPRTSSCASACTGARTSTSATSPPPGARR